MKTMQADQTAYNQLPAESEDTGQPSFGIFRICCRAKIKSLSAEFLRRFWRELPVKQFGKNRCPTSDLFDIRVFMDS
jgi:hypothetical protein